MPTLILSGGTGKTKEKKINDLFLKKVGKGKILYIPIAMEPKTYSNCEKWIKKTLKRKNIVMITSFKENISLSKFKGIYIGGGNTFKLLKLLKENKWDKKLKNFKGVIGGGSAGSIIWGKDISTASFGTYKDKNLVKLKNLKALNLVNNYNIQCHYYTKEKDQLKRHVKKTNIPIIALPNDSGILIKNNKITPINKVIIFNNL